MSKTKFSKEELKDKLDGNELDLSLCNLSKVPVREIVSGFYIINDLMFKDQVTKHMKEIETNMYVDYVSQEMIRKDFRILNVSVQYLHHKYFLGLWKCESHESR